MSRELGRVPINAPWSGGAVGAVVGAAPGAVGGRPRR